MKTPNSPKYKNKKTAALNGEVYDSAREAKRGWELSLLETAHEVCDIQRQVKYELIPKQDGERAVCYYADFVYRQLVGIDTVNGANRYVTVVEDVKSDFTRKLPAYVIKRKLMKFIHGITIREV